MSKSSAQQTQAFIQPELALNVTAPEQTTWDVESMRAGGDALQQGVAPVPEGVERTVVTLAVGEHSLELRVFTPGEGAKGVDAVPVMVAPHGGGYVAGAAHFDDARNADLAAALGVVVVSPEYRLAPEYPFPAGRDDVVAAFRWAAREYPGAPLFGFGDSAGSGLLYSAAVEYLTHHAQEGGGQLKACVYLEPCLDPSLGERSMDTYADGPIWTKKAATHAWQAYCDGAAHADVMPPVGDSVARLRDVGVEFPAAYVVVNPVDPLRDEGIRFACDLVDAGVECQLHMWEGTFHGSLGFPVDSWHEMQRGIGRFFDDRG